MLRELLRRVEMKVIHENRLDVVVRLHTGAENRILRVASAYEAASRRRISPPMFGPLRGGT